MATDSSPRTGRLGRAVGGSLRTVARLALDLFAVTVWVLFLTLLFLETAWPRWAFYALALGGVGLYVAVTPTWGRSGDESESES